MNHDNVLWVCVRGQFTTLPGQARVPLPLEARYPRPQYTPEVETQEHSAFPTILATSPYWLKEQTIHRSILYRFEEPDDPVRSRKLSNVSLLSSEG
jgi:hypothetical protein